MPSVILGAPAPIFADPSQGTPGAPSPTAGVMTVQGVTGAYPIGVIAGITGPVSVTFPNSQSVTGPIAVQGVSTGGVPHTIVTDGIGRIVTTRQSITRVLAQTFLSPTGTTDVYTCGAPSSEISTITVCNQSAGNATIGISVAINGAPDSAVQYLFRNIILRAGASLCMDNKVPLANNDVLRISSNVSNVNANVFGVELTT